MTGEAVITLLICMQMARQSLSRDGNNNFDSLVVDPADYPYIAEIKLERPFGISKLICTGTLISRSVILTAGRCLITKKKVDTTVTSVTFHRKDLSGVRKYVFKQRGKIIAQCQQPPTKSPLLGKQVDFALFSLAEPVPLCEGDMEFSILKLPVANVRSPVWKSDEAISTNTFSECSLLGFGSDSNAPSNGTMREVSGVALWAVNDRFLIPLLFKHQRGFPCAGDSGGPAVCVDGKGRDRFYGIVSHSSGALYEGFEKRRCYESKTSYLTEVLTDIRFILPQLRKGLIQMGKLEEFIEDYEKCY